ncbi:MAG: metallophosphoesterase [Roseiflexaceae bacterium]
MVTQRTQPIFVIGDVHGQFERLLGLLLNVGLVGSTMTWIGADASLWFIGDLFDRGPDSIDVVDLVMRLQSEATKVGGHVGVVLGNHEVMILTAQRFGGHFLSEWEWNGGSKADLARLTPQHLAWIAQLPAMAHVGELLLLHADATFYTNYGRSVAQVNQALRLVLQSHHAAAWNRLLELFCERRAFADTRADGAARAQQLLSTFGGRRLLHGHTPISSKSSFAPEDVGQPLVYAGGLCINVDGGMYLGGSGFVYQIR